MRQEILSPYMADVVKTTFHRRTEFPGTPATLISVPHWRYRENGLESSLTNRRSEDSLNLKFHPDRRIND